MARVKFFAAPLFCLSFIFLLLGCGGGGSNTANVAPSGPRQIFALNPPLRTTDKVYAEFNQFVLNNPNIAGVSAPMPWNFIESNDTPGAYDFSAFDAALQHIISAGKIVNLIVQPITEGGVNSFTPSYVFTANWASSCCAAPPLDVVTCGSYPGDGNPDSGMPVFTEAPFTTAYKNFIAAVLKHYANNSNVPIGYVRIGLGTGGEVAPLCVAQWPNFTNSGFFSFVQQMLQFEVSQRGPLKLEQNVRAIGSPPDINFADSLAAFAIQNNFAGFGNNGASVRDISAANAGQPCNADWCTLFDKFAGTTVNGAPVILQLQTLGITDPTNASDVGSLTQILPFAAQHHANTFELFVPDLLLAFDPNYLNTPGANPSFAPFASAYSQAIQSFRSGQ